MARGRKAARQRRSICASPDLVQVRVEGTPAHLEMLHEVLATLSGVQVLGVDEYGRAGGRQARYYSLLVPVRSSRGNDDHDEG